MSFLLPLSAQKSHNIKITIEDIPEKVLYLKGFCGSSAALMDSAVIKHKKDFTFKGKAALPSGIYDVVNADDVVLMSLIIDKERNFSVKTKFLQPLEWKSFEVEGSEDNDPYLVYQIRSRYSCQNPEELAQEYIQSSPKSLLAKYLSAKYFMSQMPDFQSEDSVALQYAWLTDHYFDNIDFSDARLLHTPINVGVKYYFSQVVFPNPDSLKYRVSQFVAKTSQCEEVKNYYLRELYDLFNNDSPLGNMMLVYLYDNYCPDGNCEWLEPVQARVFKRNVVRMRRLLPGAEIPALEAFDRDAQLVKTKDLQNDFIVLWFWDPDCDDCVEQTPKLYDFYKQNKDLYNFEVFACSITDDLDRWISFISKNDLNWINVSQAKGEFNYDFVDYFDILTTPGIYLIRKDHTLVSGQFPIEELQDYLVKEYLNNEK